ncbi:MAG: hypothetical protein LBU64_01695 [Planctomycetota bacterium]|nr:hypothetical protein [Planctomycetota bacterium]
MIRKLLLILPLVMMVLLAGCEEGGDISSGSPSTSRPSASQPSGQGSLAKTPPASVPASVAQPPARVSTTQPLPPGYGYVNERELMAAK